MTIVFHSDENTVIDTAIYGEVGMVYDIVLPTLQWFILFHSDEHV